MPLSYIHSFEHFKIPATTDPSAATSDNTNIPDDGNASALACLGFSKHGWIYFFIVMSSSKASGTLARSWALNSASLYMPFSLLLAFRNYEAVYGIGVAYSVLAGSRIWICPFSFLCL